QAAARTRFPLLPQGEPQPTCDLALADPTADTVYAVLEGYQGAAPPIFFLAYQTADAGRTWTPVPPPPGYAANSFAGFQAERSDGGAVLALFAGPPAGPDSPPQFHAQHTTDGGRHWSPAQLPCPS